MGRGSGYGEGDGHCGGEGHSGPEGNAVKGTRDGIAAQKRVKGHGTSSGWW
jgi:hypothetical protein